MEDKGEDNPDFRTYSGTTIENYQTCTTLMNGKLYFFKGFEPKHDDLSIFHYPDFNLAAQWAISIAGRLDHTPLVMSGMVDVEYMGTQELPPGIFLPIDQIFVPKPKIDWRRIDLTKSTDITDLFVYKTPSEYLVLTNP